MEGEIRLSERQGSFRVRVRPGPGDEPFRDVSSGVREGNGVSKEGSTEGREEGLEGVRDRDSGRTSEVEKSG